LKRLENRKVDLSVKFYTVCHKHVPEKRWATYVVFQKNLPQSERFFDNHYKNACGKRLTVQGGSGRDAFFTTGAA
jgi:hypothetical protein